MTRRDGWRAERRQHERGRVQHRTRIGEVDKPGIAKAAKAPRQIARLGDRHLEREGGRHPRLDDGAICGAAGAGTIFASRQAGHVTELHAFPKGTRPIGALLESEKGAWLGLAVTEGIDTRASVYSFGADSALTTLVSFDDYRGGGIPVAGLFEGSDGFFYGVTAGGGTSGSVFRVKADGTLEIVHAFRADGTVFGIGPEGDVKVIHSFDPKTEERGPSSGLVTGPDGLFYGTLCAASTSTSTGLVYKLGLNGTFSIVHQFTAAEGACPIGELTQATDGSLLGDASLHGVTKSGGEFGRVTVLHTFGGEHDSASPSAGIIQGADGPLYGTTVGTATLPGVIFRLNLTAR